MGHEAACEPSWLAPGHYRLEITRDGFQKLVRPGVEVQIQGGCPYRRCAAVGEATQTVEVTSAIPALDTENRPLRQPGAA